MNIKRRWQQKDGTWIDLKDMSDKHLKNALEMLERVKNVPIISDADDNSGDLIFIHDEEMIRAMENELYNRKGLSKKTKRVSI